MEKNEETVEIREEIPVSDEEVRTYSTTKKEKLLIWIIAVVAATLVAGGMYLYSVLAEQDDGTSVMGDVTTAVTTEK